MNIVALVAPDSGLRGALVKRKQSGTVEGAQFDLRRVYMPKFAGVRRHTRSHIRSLVHSLFRLLAHEQTWGADSALPPLVWLHSKLVVNIRRLVGRARAKCGRRETSKRSDDVKDSTNCSLLRALLSSLALTRMCAPRACACVCACVSSPFWAPLKLAFAFSLFICRKFATSLLPPVQWLEAEFGRKNSLVLWPCLGGPGARAHTHLRLCCCAAWCF